MYVSRSLPLLSILIDFGLLDVGLGCVRIRVSIPHPRAIDGDRCLRSTLSSQLPSLTTHTASVLSSYLALHRNASLESILTSARLKATQPAAAPVRIEDALEGKILGIRWSD